MTPETAKAVAELADAMGIEPDEVVARAVTALAIVRCMLWTPAPAARAVPAQANEEAM